jgi:DNA-binding GntR family transcriptional regulator
LERGALTDQVEIPSRLSSSEGGSSAAVRKRPLLRQGGLRYRTKHEFVYRTLRDAIMRCELPPRQRLVIEDLAREFQVSAIPVREALKLLQSEGLVTNVPHAGATVSAIARESVAEVFSLMEGLELVATRQAAERLTDEDAAALTETVAEMDVALEQGRLEHWADLNSRFHLTISRISGMPLLHDMMERVMAHWDRLRRCYFEGVLSQRMDQAQAEHRSLLRGMIAKDLQGLEALVKQHNQGALLAYGEYLRNRLD